MARLRAMTEADVPGAVTVFHEAFRGLAVEYSLPMSPRTEEGDLRLANRLRYLMGSDPRGSWVAEDGGTVVGLSQSFVRDGYWMLSLLAILPGHQGRGHGRGLLDLALGNAEPDSPGTIQSSRDPSAMALYSSAGFALHPAVKANGIMRMPVARDDRVRRGSAADFGLVDAVDRELRGSVRTADVAAMLREPGNRLLIVEGMGYAVAKDERLVTLGARDEPTATALLQTALAETKRGANVDVEWITARQQWAIRVVVAAGIDLHPYGAVMVRGMDGPPAPYIPSGGYG